MKLFIQVMLIVFFTGFTTGYTFSKLNQFNLDVKESMGIKTKNQRFTPELHRIKTDVNIFTSHKSV